SGVPDPHIWMDVELWKKTIPVVAEALIQNDPTHAELYNQRAEAYAIELDALDQEVRKQLLAIPDNQRYLVTSHDAFNYFARSYLATDSERENGEWQARFEAPEGLAPDSQLSTSDIQKILDHLQKHKIHTLFPESNVSKASILKIISSGKALGLDLHASPHPLYGDAMGERGSAGDSYPKMLRYNAMTISEQIRQGEVASAIPVHD
ncbi:MAG: zinc ABC transporter substrate-binding protein, partial [Chlamydiia bacterium]|nr:zinc ABC transporter substrate-binding protein [Chlamydiia bacterium]